MKQYGYSVKEALLEAFGEEALEVMRREKPKQSKEAEIIARRWQKGDEEMLSAFLDQRFLLRTEIKDDCMVYFYQEGERQCVFLLFINEQGEGPCIIDTACARELVEKWAAAGYEAKIASCSVVSGCGVYVYAPVENFGQTLLVSDTHSCWPVFCKKVAEVSATRDMGEYECLFEPTVCLTTGEKREKKILGTGLEAVMAFFRDKGPAAVCYQESKSKGLYSRQLIAGDKQIGIRVNVRNLIAEIQVADRTVKPGIPCDLGAKGESLVNSVPRLQSVRGLEIRQIHGYAVQLTYADGSLRNYYLHSLDTRDIPAQTEAEGFVWSEEILKNVAVEDNGIRFSNGYAVPAHILYYRSYRQVQAAGSRAKVYTDRLKPLYRLPLYERKPIPQPRQYRGKSDEYFGPAEALLSPEGKRLTDVSFLVNEYDTLYRKKVRRVRPESIDRWGLLQEDGSWLAPPIYESIEDDRDGYAVAKRKEGGKIEQFVLTAEGEELPFHCDDDGKLFSFNAAVERVEAPLPGYCWEYDDDSLDAGNWGYTDSHGKVVIEPRYVYATNFDKWFDGEPAEVAKLADGKLYWGAIDKTGREVIPCIYESLHTRWGDAFAYRVHGNDLYGVMTFDGIILAEPQFGCFEEYDEVHGMLTVGKHKEKLGVYSLKRQRMIIPEEYDNVGYDEHILSCERQNPYEMHYFTYEGEELDFSQYDWVSEGDGGLLEICKDEKYGYMMLDGTVVVPNILHRGKGDMLALYRKGYFISGEQHRLGLSTADGRVIVPEVYDDISEEDRFVIASQKKGICDTLYTYDGVRMLDGVCRRAVYNDKTRRLSVDTPYGTEYFQVLE